MPPNRFVRSCSQPQRRERRVARAPVVYAHKSSDQADVEQRLAEGESLIEHKKQIKAGNGGGEKPGAHVIKELDSENADQDRLGCDEQRLCKPDGYQKVLPCQPQYPGRLSRARHRHPAEKEENGNRQSSECPFGAAHAATVKNSCHRTILVGSSWSK